MSDLPRFLPRATGLAVALFAFLVAGCSSDQPDRGRRGPPPPPAPPMAGRETFFAGQILVEAQTGAGFGDSGKPDDAAPGGGGRHGGGRMGGGMRGGGGGRHGGGGGTSDGPSVDDAIEQDQISNLRRAAAAGGPPMMIHLRFTNKGTEHLNVSVVDFLSELGNFVVQPDKLALDPGQTVEVDPMTSRLVIETGQASITLVLHADGHNEKKTIALTVVTPPPGAPPASNPPATAPSGT